MASVGFRAFSALAVGKWIAVCFGPSGTALFGQMMNLYATYANIPNDGLSRAMVKEGAHAHQQEDEEATEIAVQNGLALLGILLVLEWLIAGIIYLFTNWFEPFESDGNLFSMLLFFGALSAAYYAGNMFLVWKKTQYQVLSMTFLSFGGLLGILAVSLLGYGIQECLLGFLGGQSAGGLLFFLITRKDLPLKRFRLSWYQPLAKRMIVFTLTLASTGLIHQVANYSLVHWAIDTMGTQKVGLWMAMNRFADAFNTPVLAIANSILLPMLASHASHIPKLREILRPIFRQSLVVLLVGMAMLYWLYPVLLPVLFSKEFVADPNWTKMQLFGDFFKSSTYVIAIVMLAMGHTRFYFWLETGSVAIQIGLTYGLFQIFGFEGMFLAHAIRYCLYWLAIVLNYRKILL